MSGALYPMTINKKLVQQRLLKRDLEKWKRNGMRKNNKKLDKIKGETEVSLFLNSEGRIIVKI